MRGFDRAASLDASEHLEQDRRRDLRNRLLANPWKHVLLESHQSSRCVPCAHFGGVNALMPFSSNGLEDKEERR